MKKQMFLALILLCAGISLNAMETDMTEEKPATEESRVAPAMPAPVEKVAPKEEENEVAPTPAPDEDDFDVDTTEEEVEAEVE